MSAWAPVSPATASEPGPRTGAGTASRAPGPDPAPVPEVAGTGARGAQVPTGSPGMVNSGPQAWSGEIGNRVPGASPRLAQRAS